MANETAKPDILIYGPKKPLIERGLAERFNVHIFHHPDDLAKLSPEQAQNIRGMAITNLVKADRAMLARFPKLEMIASFGVGYDHVDFRYAAEHNIVVTHTPDVLTDEVADTAIGLLIATVAKMAKPLFTQGWDWAPLIAIAAVVGVAILRWPLPYVFLGLAPLSIALAWFKKAGP